MRVISSLVRVCRWALASISRQQGGRFCVFNLDMCVHVFPVTVPSRSSSTHAVGGTPSGSGSAHRPSGRRASTGRAARRGGGRSLEVRASTVSLFNRPQTAVHSRNERQARSGRKRERLRLRHRAGRRRGRSRPPLYNHEPRSSVSVARRAPHRGTRAGRYIGWVGVTGTSKTRFHRVSAYSAPNRRYTVEPLERNGGGMSSGASTPVV